MNFEPATIVVGCWFQAHMVIDRQSPSLSQLPSSNTKLPTPNRCPPSSLIMPKPIEVTDVYNFDDMNAVNVDFQREQYRVCWHGNWQDFNKLDLTSFPEVPRATVTHPT